MENALRLLSEEHQDILKVADALVEECNSLKSGKGIDIGFFKKSIKFIKNYADKFHHAKEEDILFIELNKDDVLLNCNPTQQMLYEHNLGRNFVKGLEKGVKEKNKDKIIENATGYAQLIQEHIFKEDNILYPMAERALSKEAKNKISNKFKQVKKRFNKEEGKYLSFIRKIEEK